MAFHCAVTLVVASSYYSTAGEVELQDGLMYSVPSGEECHVS